MEKLFPQCLVGEEQAAYHHRMSHHAAVMATQKEHQFRI